MYLQTHDSVRYVDKGCVLYHLVSLMEKELSPKERKIIYCYCGMNVEAPMGFGKLADHFRFDSLEHARHSYHEAVRKTRAAIPGSELERWVASFQSVTEISLL